MWAFFRVREFLDRWSERSLADCKIDYLFNNAGLVASGKTTTSEGFELTYVTNFLSSFLLTVSIVNNGWFDPSARVVNVSSNGAYSSVPLDPEDQNSRDLTGKYADGEIMPTWSLLQMYGRSKAMQIAFTKELQGRLLSNPAHHGIVVQSCHPGLVATSIWGRHKDIPEHAKFLNRAIVLVDLLAVSSEQGAATPLFLATSAKAAQPDVLGKFWYRTSWRWPPAWIHETKRLANLWSRWEHDSGVTLPLPAA